MEGFLDFGRLGVEQGSESLEFMGKVVDRVFHGWICDLTYKSGLVIRVSALRVISARLLYFVFVSNSLNYVLKLVHLARQNVRLVRLTVHECKADRWF